MPRALLLLLLAGALAAPDPSRDPTPGLDPAPDPTRDPTPAAPASVFVIADTTNDTIAIADNVAHNVLADGNLTVSDLLAADGTLVDPDGDHDGDHDPVVRKKRTFGDIVFRGLADVLGYQVQRRPPQQAFPPPLAPVPGIDTPLQAAPAPAPAPVAAPPPCGAPRAAGPPPCRAQLPPPPPPPPKPAPPPCAKPRAAPKPKPRLPPPPPPPPCGRASPATPAPCAPPPPKVQADSNLETVSSNFQLAFNFNRAPATPATQAADEAQAPAEEQASQLEQFAPIAIKPQAARLPPAEPRKPRVYVDAFVVRNGVARRVDTVDAQHLNGNGQQAALDNDYLAYDDNEEVQDQDVRVQSQDSQDQDYTSEEDLQEYRQKDRSKAVKDFGAAVDRFWEQKQKKTRTKKKKKAPAHTSTDYRDVHFGDRELAEQIRRGGEEEERHQSLQRERPHPNRIPLPIPEEEDAELTTTTQDPRRRLKPRVLPPTEQNPGQIDTVTVRVPPIYKERHPKKLHRDDEHEVHSGEVRYEETEPAYAESSREEVGSPYERPPRPPRRRKPSRRARSAPDQDPFSAGDFDYYGKRLPVSEEEKLYRGLTIPPPTADADLARLERQPGSDGHFLDESEKLRDDRERPADREGADDDEPGSEGAGERGEETRLSDELGPNARVQQTGYKKNYRRASNVQVDDGEVQPGAAPLVRKRIRKVIKT